MNLAAYLAATGMTQADMAAEIHRSQSVISRIAAGVQEPDPTTARALIKASKGKITACALYGVAEKWCKCQ